MLLDNSSRNDKNNIIGKRVRLIHTDDDRFTHLRAGDMGTVSDATLLPESMGGKKQVWIQWDNGSKFAMIEDLDKDKIEILFEDSDGDYQKKDRKQETK
ncbi:MAG TPA: hypothetical protein VE223_05705 [Nitrososphaeraceae archaeon]|nr:hypothetical protein [Nitrososphaeraceae archaeon]